jgi:asparagine synthase (glutamine-hydrolysing)
MCGVAGFAGIGSRDNALARLKAMTDRLVHRGPDGEGRWLDPERLVALGHRRLAIIDPEGGFQPMWDAELTVGVSFNGEIYNHRDLRRTLEAKGHRFHADHSDTEVLVHGWKEWGEGLFERLNGMFAAAIYDRRAATVVLARDRMGEKPMYWSHRKGLFAFASELTALLAHPDVPRALSRRGLVKFLAHCFVPAPHTLLADVYKLRPGTLVRYRLTDDRIDERSYWTFRVEPDDRQVRRREDDLAAELAALLRQATERRLESDVPLGFLLSGGMDSSAVVAMAAGKVPPETLRTFAIGFVEPSFDESGWARRAAQAIGTVHADEICSLDGMRDGIAQLLGRIDDPPGDPSILPTHQVCSFARRHVTVALSGDGGDELFAGYDPFRALGPASVYRRFVPRAADSALASLAAALPHGTANMSLDFKLRRSLRGVRYSAEFWNPVWLGALSPDELADFAAGPIDVEDVYSEALAIWRSAESSDPVDRTLEFYTRLYLPDNNLAKTDRASMLASLELRAPFLDNDLVNFARTLPSHFKLRRGSTKYLLRQSLRQVLPADILARRKKGFGIPLAAWLKTMKEPGVPDFLPRRWLNDRWREHASGQRDWRHLLWCSLALGHSPLFGAEP